MQGKMPLIARLLGTAIVWPSTALWLLGHFMIFGTWPHWVFCERIDGDCLEAVPAEGVKSDHRFPPLLFKMRTRTLGDAE